MRSSLELPVPRKGSGPYAFDNAVRRAGFDLVAGLDEAGRGACAGPLVAAAVVLRPGGRIAGLADSKLLSPRMREVVFARIRQHALAWAVVSVDVEELDRIGLHRANLTAFRRALHRLDMAVDFALCDGFAPGGLACPELGVWKGDQVSASIAAASVVAKCVRDATMTELHDNYAEYGFDVHKGYATVQHREELRRHGPSPVHRFSFVTVRRSEGVA